MGGADMRSLSHTTSHPSSWVLSSRLEASLAGMLDLE